MVGVHGRGRGEEKLEKVAGLERTGGRWRWELAWCGRECECGLWLVGMEGAEVRRS